MESQVEYWNRYWEDSMLKSYDPSIKAGLYTRIASIINAELDGGVGVTLDMGCGVGSMLSRINTIPGMVCIGVDISNVAVDICNMQGMKVMCNDMKSVDMMGEVDAIISIDSIDCVGNPVEYIDAWKSMLKDGGLMIVAFVDGDGDCEYDRVNVINRVKMEEIMSRVGEIEMTEHVCGRVVVVARNRK